MAKYAQDEQGQYHIKFDHEFYSKDAVKEVKDGCAVGTEYINTRLAGRLAIVKEGKGTLWKCNTKSKNLYSKNFLSRFPELK